MPSSSIAFASARMPRPLVFSERKSSSMMTMGKRNFMQFSEFRNKVGPAPQASDASWFQASKCKRANTGQRQNAGARSTKRSSAGWHSGMWNMLFIVRENPGQFRANYTLRKLSRKTDCNLFDSTPCALDHLGVPGDQSTEFLRLIDAHRPTRLTDSGARGAQWRRKLSSSDGPMRANRAHGAENLEPTILA